MDSGERGQAGPSVRSVVATGARAGPGTVTVRQLKMVEFSVQDSILKFRVVTMEAVFLTIRYTI